MQRRAYLTALAGGVAALAGCGGGAEGDQASGSGDGATPTKAVTILEHDLQEQDFGTAVVGKVENTSGETQSYIEVQARFFNGSGERIGEGLDNATDVAAGRVVTFECLFAGDETVAEYDIEASTSAV